MKVKELLLRLQGVDPEMEVHIYADHGQWVQHAHYATVELHLEGDENILHPEEAEDYGNVANKIFLIR